MCSPSSSTISRPASPCVVPLSRDRALPSGVLGPVLLRAFRRLAWRCRSLGLVVVKIGGSSQERRRDPARPAQGGPTFIIVPRGRRFSGILVRTGGSARRLLAGGLARGPTIPEARIGRRATGLAPAPAQLQGGIAMGTDMRQDDRPGLAGASHGCPADADHDREVPEVDLLSPLTIRE